MLVCDVLVVFGVQGIRDSVGAELILKWIIQIFCFIPHIRLVRVFDPRKYVRTRALHVVIFQISVPHRVVPVTAVSVDLRSIDVLDIQLIVSEIFIG